MRCRSFSRHEWLQQSSKLSSISPIASQQSSGAFWRVAHVESSALRQCPVASRQQVRATGISASLTKCAMIAASRPQRR